MANKYLKFEYWNECDLGNIYYQGGQHFWFYLDGDVLEPFHEDVEDGQENGDGDFTPTYRRQVKRYRIRTSLVPDYLIDAMQRMKLHDHIYLTFKTGEVERLYNLDIEADWQFEKYSWQGTVVLTFDMDEKVVLGACCDNLTVTDAIPEWYWIAIDGSDDTGDGHYTTPWKTLAYACTQVTTPGETINMKAGTYYVSSQIIKPIGVSIRGQGDSTHIISTFTHLSNLQASIQCVSADGITTNDNSSISYLKLTGSSLTAGRGIFVGFRNGIEIHHCTIEDFLYYGIYFYASQTSYPDLFMTGHSVHHCTINNSSNRTTGYPGCVRSHGSDGLLIYNNTFDMTMRAPGSNGNTIQTWRNKRLKVYNNTFYRLDSEINSGGTYGWNFFIENWDYRGDCEYYNNTHYGLAKVDVGGELNTIDAGCTYGFKVYGNKFYNDANANRLVNGTEEDYVCITVEGDQHQGVEVYNNYMQRFNWGIALTTPSSGVGIWHHYWEWDGISVHHNIIENIGFADFQYSGIGIWWLNETNIAPYYGTFANVLIANNTITGDNGGTYPGYNGIRMDANGTATNVTISNNIITGFAQNAISLNAHSTDSLDLVNCDVTYNCFYDNGTNAVEVEAAINETNLDVATGNIVDNPDFVSSSDFRLQAGSPCINAGISVGLTSDYTGATVGNPPEIGAYEY